MKSYQRVLPYGVAICSTAIALLLRLWLEPLLFRSIGAFFYFAIIVSAWYGGFRPGFVAVVLSTLAIDYFLIPPRYQFWFEQPKDVFELGLFLLVAFLMNLLTSNFRSSKQKIERLGKQLAQENAEQLRMALSAAQMGMWDWNIVTGEINWSPEHEELFGLTPGTFDGKYETFDARLHPDDREKLNQAVQRSLKEQVPYQHEFRVVWADGSIHWVEGRGQTFYDEAGQPVRMTGTIMAIDERKQAEAALQEREAILRLFIQYAPAGIAMFDRDMRYVMASQRWVDEYNIGSLESLINRSHYELFPEISERWRQIHQRCLAGAIEKCDEDLFVRSDGTEQWISWEIRPWYTATDEIGGIIIFSVDITKRKQAETVLRESQIQLQRQLSEIESIYQSAPIGLGVLDTELRFVRINQRLAEINGLTVEAHIGCTVREVVPNLADAAEELLRSILETGEPVLNVEIIGETQAQPGVQRTWIESWLPLKDDAQIIGISVVCEEITERKQAEMALVQLNTELEQRVQERTTELTEVNDRLLETVMEQQHTQMILLEQAQLLDLAHDTIMTCDLNSVITFWNEGAEYMYGWKKAEVLGKESHTFLQTQFPKALAEIESELLARGYWEGELIHTRSDGSTITVASRWVMQKDEMGRPIKVLKINNDITVQKQAEAALRESEERRRLALDLTHLGFWDWHLPSSTLVWNDNHFTLLGLAPYSIEPTYELWRSHIHPDDIGWVEQRFLESIEHRTDYSSEYRVVHSDGSVHWLMGRAKAIYDESGQPLRVLGVLLDISDRKRIEEALRESDEKFRQLADNIQAVFWMTDVQTHQVLYVSPAYEAIWQRSCESLYQNPSNWLEAIHPDERLRMETVFVEIKKTGQYEEKYRIIRPDGSIRWIRDRAFPITNELGELVRVAGIAEDITEQEKIEQIKSEFIGIVSHELRTPLTAIKMSLGLLKSGIYDKKPDKFQRMLEIALIDTNRLVNLVNDILDLERLDSGRAVLEKTRCQAADLMQQAVDGVQPLATPQQITLTINPTDAEVWAAADAIMQTLTNLLSNAIKFSPANSTITLSAESQTDIVLFRVSDRGRGIPADKLEAIFGRFQQVDASDARQKGGTGLGLAICHSIIEQHGGQIWAESTLGEGSTFFFTLPLPTEEIG